jgi:chemotaxis protein MotB
MAGSGSPTIPREEPPAPETAERGKPPIIVRRKRGRHDGHHGGAWKVAYADFVTAMMAFFLVLWLVSQSDDVKRGVGGYFRDPLGSTTKDGGGAGILEGGSPSKQAPVPPVLDDQEAARDVLRRKAQEILEALLALPELKQLAGQIEVQLTEEGLRIQLMEGEDSTFFGVGSAVPSARGVSALTIVGNLIGSMGYDVVVEGHTDSTPYSTDRGYTNWELSADRANAARRILEDSGVPAGRVSAVRAYADTRPLRPDQPEAPRNRRVAVIVLSEAASGA